jgi:hypothetical protein
MSNILYQYYLHTKNIGHPTHFLIEKVLYDDIIYNQYKDRTKANNTEQNKEKKDDKD